MIFVLPGASSPRGRDYPTGRYRSVGDEPSPAGADPGSWRFAMSVLPERPLLEHLRKQAKARRRERGIPLSQAQHELAREYGFASWPRLVHAIQASQLRGIERVLVLADPPALATALEADPASATTMITGLPPLLKL